MPCDVKIHIVEEKWKRERERRAREAERKRQETERGIPAPEWPMKVDRPAEKPA